MRRYALIVRQSDNMEPQVLMALKNAIGKWELIVISQGVDDGRKNCPLCDLFGISCVSNGVVCPAGIECHETPYYKWNLHHAFQHNQRIPLSIQCPDCKVLAQAELDFLKSLLPKEESNADK